MLDRVPNWGIALLAGVIFSLAPACVRKLHPGARVPIYIGVPRSL